MGRIISKWISSKLITENWFPKFEHFDWLIVKLVLVLDNQNAQIWEISFAKINLEIILPKDSALNDCTQKCHCFQFTNFGLQYLLVVFDMVW